MRGSHRSCQISAACFATATKPSAFHTLCVTAALFLGTAFKHIQMLDRETLNYSCHTMILTPLLKMKVKDWSKKQHLSEWHWKIWCLIMENKSSYGNVSQVSAPSSITESICTWFDLIKKIFRGQNGLLYWMCGLLAENITTIDIRNKNIQCEYWSHLPRNNCIGRTVCVKTAGFTWLYPTLAITEEPKASGCGTKTIYDVTESDSSCTICPCACCL